MEPFRVHILGCGSALPTLRHYPSAQIVEVREKLFMVDCGEGVQMQLRRCRVRFTKVSHVFISHLHGDHCFGLIGMISTFGLLGRTAKLHIHANVLLNDMLQRQMALFCHDLGYEVEFHQIDVTRREVIYEDRSLTVETIPLTHRLPTCGFLFREKPLLPHIRREMIDFYEIPTWAINNIKAGQDWTTATGEVIANSRLTTPADPVRSYAYCSDTMPVAGLTEWCQGVDLMYHEATYAEAERALAQKYFHSTAHQAAEVAHAAKVKRLLLGHFSSRYEDEQLLLNEAKEVFPKTLLAHEELKITL